MRVGTRIPTRTACGGSTSREDPADPGEDVTDLDTERRCTGRGVTVIKTGEDDVVIGFIAGRKSDTMTIESDKSGKKFDLAADPKEASSRGGRGHQKMKRVTFRLVEKPVTIQPLANAEGSPKVN